MQNSVQDIVASWFTAVPVVDPRFPDAPAPFVHSDPYANCERMSDEERSQLVNRQFVRPTRKVGFNTNELQVVRPQRVEYHFAGHRHDKDIPAKWKNVDAGAAAQAKIDAKSGKKGKK
jgi:hypothetical protein